MRLLTVIVSLLFPLVALSSPDAAAKQLTVAGALTPVHAETLLNALDEQSTIQLQSANSAGSPEAMLDLASKVIALGTAVEVDQNARLEGNAVWLLFAAKGHLTLQGDIEIGLRAWDDGMGHDAIQYPKTLAIHQRVIALYAHAGLDEWHYWRDIARAPLETQWLSPIEANILLERLADAP